MSDEALVSLAIVLLALVPASYLTLTFVFAGQERSQRVIRSQRTLYWLLILCAVELVLTVCKASLTTKILVAIAIGVWLVTPH
jgi:hypothetical protein